MYLLTLLDKYENHYRYVIIIEVDGENRINFTVRRSKCHGIYTGPMINVFESDKKMTNKETYPEYTSRLYFTIYIFDTKYYKH